MFIFPTTIAGVSKLYEMSLGFEKTFKQLANLGQQIFDLLKSFADNIDLIELVAVQSFSLVVDFLSYSMPTMIASFILVFVSSNIIMRVVGWDS